MPRPPDTIVRARKALRSILFLNGLVIGATCAILMQEHRRQPVNERTERLFSSLLLGGVAAGFVALRALGGRGALRDPETRADRYVRSRVLTAALGLGLSTLGLVHGSLYQVGPRDLAPSWVAAIGLIALAYPRRHELDDFPDASRPSGDEPASPRPGSPAP
jgi:hypothetical protein